MAAPLNTKVEPMPSEHFLAKSLMHIVEHRPAAMLSTRVSGIGIEAIADLLIKSYFLCIISLAFPFLYNNKDRFCFLSGVI